MLKTKKCKPATNTNYCHDESSGGHKGTIFSINKKTCIKKISKISNELVFYKNHIELLKKNITVLKDYIPHYDGICNSNDKKYVIMENLKAGFKQPLTIDIKIGFKTVSKKIIIKKQKQKQTQTNKHSQKNKHTKTHKTKKNTPKKNLYYKLLQHYVLDTIITNSSKFGFRIEGVSLPKNIKLTKKTIMSAKYSNILNYYFANDINNIALENFINKLIKFETTIKSEDLKRYFFTGSSILFIYDGISPSLEPKMKLIDFDNSLVLDDELDIEKNKKNSNNFRKAISSLINVLQKYMNKKIKNLKNNKI